MKMLAMRLAMPLLGVLLWVLSIHAGTFATATLLPSPISGYGSDYDRRIPDLGLSITEKDLNSSVTFANNIINYMKRLEMNLGWSDITVQVGTPSHGMFISFAPEREAVKRGRDALIALKASVQLGNSFCNQHNVNHQDCARYLTNFKFKKTPLKLSCSQLERNCSPEEYLSAYRSMDGSCNHVSRGSKGESFTGYTRLLYPDYLDGIHEPRRAINKKALPSARLVSTSLVHHNDQPDDRMTLAVMQWGQFVEHDLSRTATAVMVHTENSIDCCGPDGNNLSPRYIHPFCSPVYVPSDDKFYADKGVDCMSYVRSIPALRADCSFGPSDQVNQATHYLDGSQIYGSTIRKSARLRSYVDGKLDVSSLNGKHYLPISQSPKEDCQVVSNQSSCFISGDSRVNFQPQLTVMHTIWYREHNRIAKQLAELNHQWDDETLFQEARRIVVAEIQHITYNEWLPKILAHQHINKIKSGNYNEKINPSVSNSFSTAAMRALKSLYDGKIKLFEEDRVVNGTVSLEKYFNKPGLIEQPGILDALVRGLTTQSSQRMDMNYAEDLIHRLYTNDHYGFDVLSMDIQRGRDHGLPSYSRYRSLCGLPKLPKFSEFGDVMSEENMKALSSVYTNLRDVDLIIGGLMENPESDSLFGPTFSCIIADQFKRTRSGDRYFYTNENQPKPFAASQLSEIKKVTLARIFCDNSDVTMMQPDAFEKISSSNNLVSCDGHDIPRMGLVPWRENREYYY